MKGDDPAEERATGRKSLTVAELCDRYLAAAERGLIMGKRGLPKKAGTIYTDRGRIARHIVPLLGSQARPRSGSGGHQPIHPRRRRRQDRRRREDREQARQGGRRGRARHGDAHRRTARRHPLLCRERGHHRDNPARGVRRPAGQRRKRRLSGDEYKALGRALAEADARHEPWQLIAIVRLLALTGRASRRDRPAEMVGGRSGVALPASRRFEGGRVDAAARRAGAQASRGAREDRRLRLSGGATRSGRLRRHGRRLASPDAARRT